MLHAEQFPVPPYFTKSQISTLTEMLKESRQAASDHLQEYVERVLGSLRQKIALHFVLEEDHPVEAILSHARKQAADLIVLGTHGRRGGETDLVGIGC